MIMAPMSLTAFWVGTTNYDTPGMEDNTMMGARIMSMSISDGAGTRDGRCWPHGVYLYCKIHVGPAHTAQHCKRERMTLPPLHGTPPITLITNIT